VEPDRTKRLAIANRSRNSICPGQYEYTLQKNFGPWGPAPTRLEVVADL